MESPLEKLRNEVIEKPTTLDIVSSLLNNDNIEMKTEILNPYALTTLMSIACYLKQHGQPYAYELINIWVKKLLDYMVSNKRASRKEITEILKGYFAFEREKEKQFSLTSNLAKLNRTPTF